MTGPTQITTKALPGKSSAPGHSINNYRNLLMAGNGLMLAATIMTLVTIVICYIYPEHFSLLLQLLGHITMLIAVTAIKIGYLMRCIGLDGMGVRQL